MSQPLICIASASDAGVAFACNLIAALHAHGRPSIALCEAERGLSAIDAERVADALRGAGADDVVLLGPTQRRARALTALQALRVGAVAVAVGTELASQLGGLLMIAVDGRMHVAEPTIDLELRAEALGVASRLGTWLAERLDRGARGSYQ
ncbi:MAG: hypothetical protein ACHQ53_11215 [Polyangiales bacterium]